jgi:hypothetical protein
MLLVSADDGYWLLVERASWITVTVSLLVGLLAVAYQVRQLRLDQVRWSSQQERIAAELAKAPDLRFGFVPDEAAIVAAPKISDLFVNDIALAATWPEGEDLSNPIEITVYMVNRGERSAKDMDLEIRFTKGPVRAFHTEDEDGITGLRPDGSLRRYVADFRLNPTGWWRFVFRVKVPKSITQTKITFVGVMENYPRFTGELTVRVEYRGVAPRAPLQAQAMPPPSR